VRPLESLPATASGDVVVASQAPSQCFPEAALAATAQLLGRCLRARLRLGRQPGVWQLPAGPAARARGALSPVLTPAAAELPALLLLVTLALVSIAMAPTAGAGSRPSRSACSGHRSLELTAVPAPFAATALGQLWQLAAAEFRDGLAMWGCQSADFQGLSRLWNVCICLRLPRADLASVRLAPWRSAVPDARGLDRGLARGRSGARPLC
jgi:hypothetical protein